jgi:WD40 repeat protein
MVVTRLNTNAALIVSMYLVATGAGWADSPKTEDDKQAKKDYYGDPLPPGVLARLGTMQLRHFNADFAFSSDGKSLISAGIDQRVQTWDVATGKLAKTIKIQRTTRKSESFHQLKLAPSGQILAVWEGKHAFVYNTSTGKEIQSVPVEEAEHVWFTFSADAKTLAIVARIPGGSGNLHVWDVDTGKKRFSLTPGISIWQVAFSPDGKRLAVSTSPDKLCLLDAANGKELAHVAANGWSLAFSPDGKTITTSSGSDEPVNLWDAVTLEAKEPIKVGAIGGISNLTFAPDASRLGLRDQEGLVVWDLSKQKVIQRFKDANWGAPVFTPDGKILATQGMGCEIRLWDISTGEPIHQRPAHGNFIESIAISSDGRTVASASLHDPNLRLWDALSGKPLRSLNGQDRYIQSCAFSPDDKLVVSAGAEGTIQIWEVAGGKEVRKFAAEGKANQRYTRSITPIQFVGNGKHIAAVCHVIDGSEMSQVLVWEAATGELSSHRPYHADIRSGPTANGGRFTTFRLHASFTPDGKGVTERSVEGVTIQETVTGHVQATLTEVVGRPLSFSSDGRLVAAAGIAKSKDDSTDDDEVDGVRLVEMATGKEVVHFQTGKVNNLDLSPDGQLLATVDKEAIRFWDVATGKKLVQRPWPDPYPHVALWGPANCLRFLPNGKGLITGMHDGMIFVWDVPAEARPAPQQAKDLGTKELDGLWDNLADDPPKAYPAILALWQSPTQAVLYLKSRLKPAEEIDPKQIWPLLADLDSDQFATRENAAKELAKLGEPIKPALRKALEGKPSEEVRKQVKELLDLPRAVPSGETLRTLRAIQVLERIGTKEACAVLKKLSIGAEGARETQETKEALARLSRKAELDR